MGVGNISCRHRMVLIPQPICTISLSRIFYVIMSDIYVMMFDIYAMISMHIEMLYGTSNSKL